MPRRRIKRAKIDFISLCPRGANGFGVVYKNDDSFSLETVIKEWGGDFDEKGELVAVVYAPEVTDSQGDIASAEVIKEMMYEAAKRGEGIDIRHDGKALSKDAAFVAERFVIQKGDPRFKDFTDYDGNKVDVTGGWGTVIKIDDPGLRKEYREGKWNGVSMGGFAEFETLKSSDEEKGFLNKLRRLLNNEPDDSGEIEMKPEELEATLKANNKTLVDTLTDGLGKLFKSAGILKEAESDEDKIKRLEKENETLKKGGKPDKNDADETGEDGAPVFKGDRTNAEDVKKHVEKVKAWQLQKDVDWNDPESVEKYHAELAKLNKSKDGEEEENLTPEEKQIKKMEAEIATLRKRSNRGTSDNNGGSDDEVTGYEGMTKEDQDLFKIGLEMAENINKDRGFVETKSA